MRFLSALRRAFVYESRGGRPAEIAAWSNAFAALSCGAAAWVGTRAPLAGGLAAIVVFALLRLALASRATVWFAAVVGTIAVGALGGGLAWLLSHVVEVAALPPFAAAAGAFAASLLPAWAYREIARRRVDVRDSILTPMPVSARSSRP